MFGRKTAGKARQCYEFDVSIEISDVAAKKRLLYFVTLLMVVKCGKIDVKLLFNMSFYYFIHGMIGSNVEWYVDAILPTSS